MSRYFVKCKSCFTVSALESELKDNFDFERWLLSARCGICEGQLSNMGAVKGSFLVKKHVHCPCDERCTYARGPHCDCSCNGKNHGSQRVVVVHSIEGGLPAIAPALDSSARQKLLAQVEELKGLRETALQALEKTRFRAAYEARDQRYLNADEWEDYLTFKRLRDLIFKSDKLSSFAGRKKSLQKALERIGFEARVF